ncbi:MAG: bifunctional precorrin-2 dehydrogenase/sirohydrochlorin ferrochelatase [Persephonella sp.]|nr:MAG: bifunctional precorrin-2 dehydrogenase/sirohydrochlorin ferrochelatase [Persephonella sp.]
MAYFPLFIDLKDKNILIVGGGKVAERKIDVLLQFLPNITVITKEIKSERIKELYEKNKIRLKLKPFDMEDLKDRDLVIVAVDNIPLQEKIYRECVKRKIPVNSVDSLDFCSFIFPAIVREDDIVIGISTSGKAPSLAGKLKEIIRDCLPENLKSVLKDMVRLRESLPKGRERQKILINFLKKRLED